MNRDHGDRIREQFRSQAQTYSTTGFAARGLDWIVGMIAPDGSESVLDVACGAAHLGRALAPRTRWVQGLDLVPEMLEQGRRLAEADGIGNLSLLRGDATALPWVDGQFDLVVCRLALHQVDDPAAVVAEMARAARRGGRLALVDVCADPNPVIAAEANRLERLRDPSHGRTLAETEFADMVEEAGAVVESQMVKDQPLGLEDWMARTSTPESAREEIRRLVGEELAGGAPTGLIPFRDSDGAIGLRRPWTIVIARVPTTSPVDEQHGLEHSA